jgi:hypothetical protein
MKLAKEGMGTVERTFRRRMNQTSSGADLRGDLVNSRGLLFFKGCPQGKWALQGFRKNSCVSGRKPLKIWRLMLEWLLQGPSRKKLTPKFSLLKLSVISQKEVIPGVSAFCAHY